MTPLRNRGKRWRIRFNPCCCGFWSVTCLATSRIRRVGRFQSLLLWILVCDIMGGCSTFPKGKFQSLLLWILVCDYTIRANMVEHAEFQSLLLWILVCDLRYRYGIVGNTGFQSLLLWILVCDQIQVRFIRFCSVCFNPCCCGFWSVTSSGFAHAAGDGGFQSLLLWILVCDSVP